MTVRESDRQAGFGGTLASLGRFPLRRPLLGLLAGLTVVGFVVRLFPIDVGFHVWDETVYLQHAEIVADLRPNTYNEFHIRPPLIWVSLGLLFSVVHSVVLAHVLIAAVATSGIVLTYVLGRRLFSPTVGFVGAFVYAVSPEHVEMSNAILVDSLLPVAWLLVALGTLSLARNGSRWTAFFTGVVVGLAVLLKFTSLVLLPAVAAVLGLSALAETRSLRRTVERTVGRSPLWLVGVGCLLALVPYLAWNVVRFGSPLYTILEASTSFGPSSFWVYVAGFGQLVPLVLVPALVVFVLRIRHVDVVPAVLLSTFALALFVPMQFVVEHREVRYLLPMVPFLAIAVGVGLREAARLARLSPSGVRILVAVMLVAATVPVWTSPSVAPVRHGDLTREYYPPVYEAATWLRSETPADTRVYANFNYPPMAYYSERQLRPLPHGTGWQDNFGAAVDGPGYVYYSTYAPDGQEPTLRFLRSDPRFRLAATIGDGEAYLFYYLGEGS